MNHAPKHAQPTSVIAGLCIAIGTFLAPVNVHAETKTIGDTLDDAMLNVAVRVALLEHLGADALDLEVDADSDTGAVVVRGDVADRSARELTNEIVRSVNGVAEVSTDLGFESTSPDASTKIGDEIKRELSDALLEARASAALMGEIGANALDLEIESADGAVTLRGTVDTDETHRSAVNAAGQVEGVVKVIDLITVK